MEPQIQYVQSADGVSVPSERWVKDARRPPQDPQRPNETRALAREGASPIANYSANHSEFTDRGTDRAHSCE